MDEQAVKEFWQGHPCGDAQVGGLRDRFRGDYDRFFTDYDQFRYRNERHLPACLAALNVTGKKLLEIGLGEGAESERLIRQGARWSGVDLTAEAVERVRTRLTLRELPYDELRQGSVLDLPFADDSFDMVFSHGVLHHVPEIKQAQSEIHRVLRPGGELVIMMYARWSLNYLVSIGLIRRATLVAAYPLARAGILSADPAGGCWPPISPTPGTKDWPVTSAWTSSSTATPTGPPTRTPWCMTAGASSATFRPSGSPVPTGASCMLRPCRYTGCRARPSWGGICGLIWTR